MVVLLSVAAALTLTTPNASSDAQIPSAAHGSYQSVARAALSPLQRPARLDVSDVTLPRALEVLHYTSGVLIVFSPTLLPADLRVTCQCRSANVKQALERLLAGTNLRFAPAGEQVLITRRPADGTIASIPAPAALAAAKIAAGTPRALPPLRMLTGTVSGRVIDRRTLAPIASVQVVLRGAGAGTLSGPNGRFVINNVPVGSHVVEAVRIGYQSTSETVEVRDGETSNVELQMVSEALALDAIVVTGQAGQARRREVGNTISQINASALEEPVLNLESMLQGRATGLTIGEVSSQAGSGSVMRLRGNTSVSISNQPLVYIDGVRVRSEAYPKNVPATGFEGRSGNVRASPLNDINPNDVERIEIIKGAAATTLYGTEAAAGVIQIFTRRGTSGSPQWTAQMDQGFARLLPFAGNSRAFPEAGTTEPHMRLDPWLRDGHRQKYYLSARGGLPNLTYFVSGGLESNEGVLPNDLEERVNLSSAFGFSPISNVNILLSGALVSTDIQNTGAGNNVHALPVNAYRGASNNVGGYSKERLDPLLEYDIRTAIDRLIAGVTIDHSITSNLSHRLIVGLDRATSEMRQIRPYGFVLAPLGILSNTHWVGETLSVDYSANWNVGISDDLRATVSAGAQSVENSEQSVSGYAEEFPGPGEHTLSSAARSLSFEDRIRIITGGMFGQVRLEYRDRVFLTGGLRLDGNSAFGENLGLEPYPKVSLSYVVSEEPFWREQWGDVKLRAAYGHAGRAPGAFDAIRTWEPTRLGNSPAFLPRNVGNADLGPERTREIELGFDASFFGDRIVTDFTYYHARTTDALFPIRQIPSLGGWASQLENVGTIQNKGVELSVNARLLDRRQYGWELGVGVATNHSLVLSLGDAPEFSVGTLAFIREGYPVGVLVGSRLLNPTDRADPDVERNYYFGPNQPTTVIQPTTRIRLPANIILSARGEYQGGHYVRDGATSNGIQRGVPQATCLEARELMAAGRTAELPAKFRLLCDFSKYRQDQFIFKADFFKLRDITAQVPVTRFVPRSSNATLSLSARNAIRWFNEDWFAYDPEMGANEGHAALIRDLSEQVPPAAVFVASLRVNF